MVSYKKKIKKDATKRALSFGCILSAAGSEGKRERQSLELKLWAHLGRRGVAVFGQVVQGRAKGHQHDPAHAHREHVSRAQSILVVFADILRCRLDRAVFSPPAPIWRTWRRGAQQSLHFRRLVLIARVRVSIRASHLVAPKDLQAEG